MREPLWVRIIDKIFQVLFFVWLLCLFLVFVIWAAELTGVIR